ncbi:MAG TPA: RIP metalloprotease RseP [Rubrivivax sp.]|jgi:regulator of sigma E protease|nr:RIP metalloprotease RseP [Rubrivivax sp.]HPP83590.1 RIP metalloprotease RseP [Rubrivivax sp.]
MNYVVGLLVTLGVLIVIHEWGHYRVAVACGVKVLRFSVGFGRVLWRWRRRADGTEFVVCALPLGGYVRMLDEREAPVEASERHRAFNRQSLARRSAIVAAGPLANLALAVVLFAAASWAGVQEPKALFGAPVAGSIAERAGLRSGDWVQAAAVDGSAWRDVSSMPDLLWQITQAAMQREALALRVTDRDGRGAHTVTLDLAGLDAGEVDAGLAHRIGLGPAFGEPLVGDVKADGPAAQAGLRPGDRVLAIDGGAVPDSGVLRERIRAGVRQGQPLVQHWVVERGARQVDLDVVPRVDASAAAPYGRIDAMIGSPAALVTVRYGLVDGAARGLRRTWDTSTFTLKMLARMVVGEVSLKNLSGPISIADYAGQSVKAGPVRFVEFLAIVSVSLGVLNLLPLPMLDGGHLMYYIFEGVTGRPISEIWLARLQRGGIAVLLAMMSVALYNDVARLLGL